MSMFQEMQMHADSKGKVALDNITASRVDNKRLFVVCSATVPKYAG